MLVGLNRAEYRPVTGEWGEGNRAQIVKMISEQEGENGLSRKVGANALFPLPSSPWIRL